MQGLHSIFALFWAIEKAGVRQPLVILSPLLGTPVNDGTYKGRMILPCH